MDELARQARRDLHSGVAPSPSAIVRNTCLCPGTGSNSGHNATFTIDTTPGATQKRALELLSAISV